MQIWKQFKKKSNFVHFEVKNVFISILHTVTKKSKKMYEQGLFYRYFKFKFGQNHILARMQDTLQ